MVFYLTPVHLSVSRFNFILIAIIFCVVSFRGGEVCDGYDETQSRCNRQDQTRKGLEETEEEDREESGNGVQQRRFKRPTEGRRFVNRWVAKGYDHKINGAWLLRGRLLVYDVQRRECKCLFNYVGEELLANQVCTYITTGVFWMINFCTYRSFVDDCMHFLENF